MDQEAVNAAARAAVEFIMQNPIQGMNVAPAVNTFHMLQTFRKYDGSYAASNWLRDFNRERIAYHLDATWCIHNLDRVLQGTPLIWWNAKKGVYLNLLNVVGAVPDNVWTQVENNLRQFFNEANIRNKARSELHTIQFVIGSDPMEYVAKKTECIMRLNPTMEVEEQVRHLLLGLPEQLRALVSPSDINTVDAFFRKLSQQVTLHRKTLEKSVSYASAASNPQIRNGNFEARGNSPPPILDASEENAGNNNIQGVQAQQQQQPVPALINYDDIDEDPQPEN